MDLCFGFIILVAPVTCVATLGFSMLSMNAGVRKCIKFTWTYQYLLGGVISPLVGLMGEENYVPYVTIILIAGILLIVLQVMSYLC